MSETSGVLTVERTQQGENLFKKDFIFPFPKNTPTEIINGWDYDPIGKIHKVTHHRAIDFGLEPCTPILAVANGIVIATSQFRYIKPKNRNGFIGFGLGNYIEIHHLGSEIITRYGHLQNIYPAIPYIQPDKTEKGFNSTFLENITLEELRRFGVFIKQGEVIGNSGFSGLSDNQEEFPLDSAYPDSNVQYWEPNPHLHFEVMRLDENGKRQPVDPFGLYSDEITDYQRLLAEMRQR